jgi:hypothetical protein
MYTPNLLGYRQNIWTKYIICRQIQENVGLLRPKGPSKVYTLSSFIVLLTCIVGECSSRSYQSSKYEPKPRGRLRVS